MTDTAPTTRASTTTGLGVAATSGAVVAWGFGPNLAKLMKVGGLSVAFHRMWLAAAVLALIVAVRGRRPEAEHVKRSLLAGLAFGLNACFFFSAVKETSIADATLIASMSPVMILVVAGRWFGERVTAASVIWTGLAVAGVGLVVLGSSSTAAWSLYGDFLAFLSLLTWTAYFLLSKWAREVVGTLEFQAGVTAGATAVVAVAAALTGDIGASLDSRDIVLLVLMVAGPGLGGHLLMAWAHRYVDVSASSVIVVAQPLVATAVAAVMVDEPITLMQAVGALIVVTAIAAVVRGNRSIGNNVAVESVESV